MDCVGNFPTFTIEGDTYFRDYEMCLNDGIVGRNRLTNGMCELIILEYEMYQPIAIHSTEC